MAYDKVVDSAALEAGLTKICDAVRAKGGTSSQLAFPDAIADAVTAIPSGGGGTDLADALITGNITECKSNATSVGEKRLSNCTKLLSVNLPKATTIGRFALDYCYNMTSLLLPSATTIENYAFNNCLSLPSLALPNAQSIGSYAFNNCDALDELRLEGPIVCVAKGALYLNDHCKIYVPASLIDQYKSATNWSKYATQFVAI